MDILGGISLGFESALTATNIWMVLLGVLLGTVIGILPGLGSATGVAILLPLTLSMEPLTALILLAGIYYGSQYGASTTAILINTPGDAASAVTALDGYAMGRMGRAGPAIAIAAISSFLAGTLSLVLLTALLPYLGRWALNFGPPEQFALALFGLVAVAGLMRGRVVRSLAMAAFGLVLATVGLDPLSGIPRFTFGSIELSAGIDLIAVVIGLFAIAELVVRAADPPRQRESVRISGLWPNRQELRRLVAPSLRGTGVGFFVGVLPGAGATVASFLSYGLERRVSKWRDQLGSGAVEGVAGPEASNNAAVNGAFVPALTLGIPGSATTAVLLGAFLVFGITPGPLFMAEHSEIAWGLIASFYLGNVALLVLNLPLAPAFAQLLRVPYSLLYPIIIAVCFIGAFATANDPFAIWTALLFGAVGYFLIKNGYPVVPIILGLVLGHIMEPALSQTSRMGGGDMSILLTRPVSAVFILATAGILVFALIRSLRSSSKPQARELIGVGEDA